MGGGHLLALRSFRTRVWVRGATFTGAALSVRLIQYSMPVVVVVGGGWVVVSAVVVAVIAVVAVVVVVVAVVIVL